MSRHSSFKLQRVRLHVVAIKSFLLGVVLTLSSIAMVYFKSTSSYLFRVAVYVAITCIFHLLEFFLTAIRNTAEVNDDSFILEDPDLYLVFMASILEANLKLIGNAFRFSHTWFLLGLLIVFFGQWCRSLAMYTAGASFNHYIQTEASRKRAMVTRGIYKYMRHPSYFGYFWWFVGSQVLLQNPVMGCIGGYKLHRFFSDRIAYEEQYLVAFFGERYEQYRKKTPTRMPCID